MRRVIDIPFIFYVLIHPFKGFWDLKYEKRGTITAASLLYGVFLITALLRSQLTGFVVEDINQADFHLVSELLTVLLPIALWWVANWGTTTLMDGKGSFSDIYIALAYSLVPLLLVNVPLTVLSHMVTMGEVAFITFFNGVAVVWTAFLIFVSTMTIHEYTAGKTTGTILLIVIAILILLILGMMFITLMQQVINFFYLFYQELSFRL